VGLQLVGPLNGQLMILVNCLGTNSIDDIENDNKRFIRHRFI
jgi:hypothetical protein